VFKELGGLDLVNYIRDSKPKFIDSFINPPKLYESEQPLVSIITSKFKGDEHIEAFLENITSQSVFASCELIIVDATPGPSCSTILEYQRKYDNIIYNKLEKDPGIYGCWNKAIKLSKGKYITNANLDDRRADTHIAHHVRFLEHNEDIDLAYSEVFLTNNDFENYYINSSKGMVYPTMDFSNVNMQRCLPGCMPVWRAKIHDNDMMFDASFKSAGDWEMWLRAIDNGSTFARIPGIYGMYYMNPTGLSTNPETQKEKQMEEKSVFDKYSHIFGRS
jgi:glycosyltransferase involved in cell wall biosynthesis